MDTQHFRFKAKKIRRIFQIKSTYIDSIVECVVVCLLWVAIESFSFRALFAGSFMIGSLISQVPGLWMCPKRGVLYQHGFPVFTRARTWHVVYSRGLVSSYSAGMQRQPIPPARSHKQKIVSNIYCWTVWNLKKKVLSERSENSRC